MSDAKYSPRPMSDTLCTLCGHPMPKGEEVFKFHGYSGNCPVESGESTMQYAKRQAAEMDQWPAEKREACGLPLHDHGPAVDDTQAVIDASRRVSDDPHASVGDLRFHLNAAIYALEEQRAMYRARLRETQQDAKLRIRQAQAGAASDGSPR